MEIQRVARELYKALSGMNEEFEQVTKYVEIRKRDDASTAWWAPTK